MRRSLPVVLALCHGSGAGWVDPKTPLDALTTYSYEDGRLYDLVMSDEFDVHGRTFHDGDDPVWTATLHSDDSMTSSGLGSQQFYNSSYVTTTNGFLNISTVSAITKWRGFNPYKKKYETLQKYFKSAMISSWNKFCFTGGIIEMNAILPGEAEIGGLWPAFWLLGNLGRATYEATTNLVWPWSYNTCNRKLQRAQEISACNGVKHFGMHAHQGRGSTEIDIIEVMAGSTNDPLMMLTKKVSLPYVSTTLQVAPGRDSHRPKNGELLTSRQEWYKGMRYGENSTQNYHFYGLAVDKTSAVEPVFRSADQAYMADGISAITKLEDTHFKEPHKYRLEWIPGPEGYLRWYLDDELLFALDNTTLTDMKTQIPDEPSYIILNTAVSNAWGFPLPCPPGCPCSCYDCDDPECKCGMPAGLCGMLPAFFMVDYVRVWQNKNDSRQTVGCDPPSHPTSLFIKAHAARYMRENDKKPLRELYHGGGACKSSKQCGQGVCASGSCKCLDGYVGPHCLTLHYHDDVVYSHETDLTPMPVQLAPAFVTMACALAAGVLGASLFLGYKSKVKSRRRYLDELQAAGTGYR